jgi:hypothetical protein
MVRHCPLTQQATMNGGSASASEPTMIKAAAAASNIIFHMIFASATNQELTNTVMFLFEPTYSVKTGKGWRVSSQLKIANDCQLRPS